MTNVEQARQEIKKVVLSKEITFNELRNLAQRSRECLP